MGAVIAEGPEGETVISGFAPVPDTDWAVITQEKWQSVVGPIRGFSRVLLGLLVLGGVLSEVLIFIGIGRILKPIKDLTRGAQRIASGDFDHTITASTGDEIQGLADQFNTMASALKESYTDLEQKVAVRTEALSESEERYRTLFEDSRDAIFISSGDGKLVEGNQAALDLFGFTRDEAIGLDVGERFVDPSDRERFRAEMGRVGSVRGFGVKLRQKDGTEIDCLLAATRQFDSEGKSLGVRGIIHDISERKHAEEQERELAVLDERNRMAREIHDTLAQGFTGIVLQFEAAEQALDGSPAEVADHLSRAKNLGRESLQEARRSVWNLLPHTLEELSLDAALQKEVRKFDAGGQEKAYFNVSGDRRELSPDIQTALLRICQESLANIRRHASAKEVNVSLMFYPDAVSLAVQDNGMGFDQEGVKTRGGRSGFGLTGMEQRAHLLQGVLDVKSEKDKGTLVEARIPIK